MEGVNLLGFVVQKSNMVVGGWWWYKPNIGHNSNSTLGGVKLTWSGDGVEREWRWSWELSWSLAIELRLWRLAITNHTLSGVFPVCDIVIIVAISLGPGPAAPVAKKRFSPKVRVESPGRLARSPIASPQNSGT